MSKGIPDEFAGSERLWRKLLREPDALPGEALADKDAAWDKLFERLNARPRRRFSGYRIAAAILLILLIPAARLFQDRPVPAKRVVPGKIQPLAGKGLPATPVAQPAVPVTQPRQPVAASPQAHSSRKNGLMPFAVRPRSGQTAPMPGAEHPGPEQTAKAVGPGPIAPATLTAVAPVLLATSTLPPAHPPKPAPKKQWKVVDIHELEPGHAPPPGMMADRQPHLLRLGLGIRNIPATDNLPPAREEDSRLKINLSAQTQN